VKIVIRLRQTLALSLLLALIASLSIASASADAGKSVVAGSITGTMRVPKSDELKKAIEGRYLAKLGWFEEDAYYVKKVRLNKVMVSIDGVETMTDENGLFKLQNVSTGTHTFKVLDIEQKPLLESTIKVEADKALQKNVKLVYDVGGKGCCGEDGCESSQAKSTSTVAKAIESVKGLLGLESAEAIYPCRDYNGSYGNCVNYDSGTGKYINFIGSD